MIHQPSGGAQGQATDIEIQAREIWRCGRGSTRSMCGIPASRSRPLPTAVERDKFLSPLEAKEFGLVDEVVETRPARDEPRKGFK